MPQVPQSAYLHEHRAVFKEAVRLLASRFDYISLLATDDEGVSFRAAPGMTEVSEPDWGQRGLVFRAQRGGIVVEHALNRPAPEPGTLAEAVRDALEKLLEASQTAQAPGHPALPDPESAGSFEGRVLTDPFSLDPSSLLERLSKIRDDFMAKPLVASARTRADFVRVSRLFLSPHKDLDQSWIWSQAYITGVVRKDALSKLSYRAVSGRKGAEILSELEASAPSLLSELDELLRAEPIEPGEYEVILSPDISGTLAHESFGHGVELDMFVKGRAKAAEFLGKSVASSQLRLYDGASRIDHTGSYFFDDEGNPATETLVIEDGVFRAGLSDALSAAALGLKPTGNGRRQAYDHKAYARMTNTYIAPGKDRLEDMICSVKKGWLLDRLNSGMEDPRNWGIQLVALVGREIVDGRFSGRIASPVICSGYVPEVLSAISMISGDFELGGSGACGKGYKEYAKVSSGGPYIKTIMRLG